MPYNKERQYQPSLTPLEEWQRLLDQHRFHNPLTPKTCYICKVELYRQDNTPVQRWSRAVRTALRPPMPVLVLLGIILLQGIILTAALAS